jgi:hypothetical protein
MMRIVIFLLTSLLGTVDIQIGMALGLFVIFVILRFRTENFTIKEIDTIKNDAELIIWYNATKH